MAFTAADQNQIKIPRHARLSELRLGAARSKPHELGVSSSVIAYLDPFE
jgi:hypothetical protein